MPQLAMTAAHMGAEGNLRCPYLAVVMNTLGATSSTIGRIGRRAGGMDVNRRRGESL
jgi:hypothetical protein